MARMSYISSVERYHEYEHVIHSLLESILMSMPPYAEWHYNYKPEPGSDEEKSTRYFAKEINWITL